jgi:hypothetical protein
MAVRGKCAGNNKKLSVGLIKKTPSPTEKILFIVRSLLWGYL